MFIMYAYMYIYVNDDTLDINKKSGINRTYAKYQIIKSTLGLSNKT